MWNPKWENLKRKAHVTIYNFAAQRVAWVPKESQITFIGIKKGFRSPTTRASDPGESCKQLMHNHTEMDKQLNCVLSEFSLKENQSDN
jgi:hypothetical protein